MTNQVEFEDLFWHKGFLFQCVKLRFSAQSRHVTHLVDIGKRSTLNLLEHSRWDVSPAKSSVSSASSVMLVGQCYREIKALGPGDIELS